MLTVINTDSDVSKKSLEALEGLEKIINVRVIQL